MSREESKILLTDAFVDLIRLARGLNQNMKISGDLYFHPAESQNRIIVKTTALNQCNPLREVNSTTAGGQRWEERWIEAYLINEAKGNGWELDLAGRRCRFLASQFTFRKNRRLEKEKAKHTHIDLLLYDKVGGCLVVLELKKHAVVSSSEAKDELEIYVEEIRQLIRKENAAFNRAFDLDVAKDACVIGYIVCPESDRVIQEQALGEFRLLQYTKPWRKFEEVKESGKEMRMEFTCPPCRDRLAR